MKVAKFHQIMHTADDILNFGVPMEVDTGANESGHEPTKKAAMPTQRNEEKFNHQTARRLQEMHLLEIAMAEMQGMHMWFPGQCSAKLSANEENPDTASTGGAKFMMHFDEDMNSQSSKR